MDRLDKLSIITVIASIMAYSFVFYNRNYVGRNSLPVEYMYLIPLLLLIICVVVNAVVIYKIKKNQQSTTYPIIFLVITVLLIILLIRMMYFDLTTSYPI